MADTLVVIATYNEKENLAPLVKAVARLSVPLDILIIDDNSPDGTGRIADSLARTWPQVKVMHRKGKLGLGTAHVEGFRFSLAQQYRYVLTMDADFSHDPAYIPLLIAGGTKSDVVVGSRYVPTGGVRNWSPQRLFLSTIANSCARIALGLKTRDCTAGFRLYRTQALNDPQILESAHSNGYSFLLELLYKCQRKGLRITEVPIIFTDRRVGVSKISRFEIIKAFRTLLVFGWQRWRLHNG